MSDRIHIHHRRREILAREQHGERLSQEAAHNRRDHHSSIAAVNDEAKKLMEHERILRRRTLEARIIDDEKRLINEYHATMAREAQVNEWREGHKRLTEARAARKHHDAILARKQRDIVSYYTFFMYSLSLLSLSIISANGVVI
jgi:rubrerythrin